MGAINRFLAPTAAVVLPTLVLSAAREWHDRESRHALLSVQHEAAKVGILTDLRQLMPAHLPASQNGASLMIKAINDLHPSAEMTDWIRGEIGATPFMKQTRILEPVAQRILSLPKGWEMDPRLLEESWQNGAAVLFLGGLLARARVLAKTEPVRARRLLETVRRIALRFRKGRYPANEFLGSLAFSSMQRSAISIAYSGKPQDARKLQFLFDPVPQTSDLRTRFKIQCAIDIGKLRKLDMRDLDISQNTARRLKDVLFVRRVESKIIRYYIEMVEGARAEMTMEKRESLDTRARSACKLTGEETAVFNHVVEDNVYIVSHDYNSPRPILLSWFLKFCEQGHKIPSGLEDARDANGYRIKIEDSPMRFVVFADRPRPRYSTGPDPTERIEVSRGRGYFY